MSAEKCQQTGKVCHLSQGKAEAQLRSLKSQGPYDGEVYHCDFCHCWHVGRPKQNAHKNKYKKR